MRIGRVGLVVALCLLWQVSCSLPLVDRLWPTAAPSPIVEAPLVTSESAPPIDGKFIYDLPNGKLWSMSVTPGVKPVPLFPIPPGTFAFQPVWSAAAQQLAYGYIGPNRETGKPTSAQLWVAAIDGSNARQVTAPAAEFAGTYRDPTWAPDGKTLWATVQLPVQDANGVIRFRSEIRRIDVATGAERIVVAEGESPALSPSAQQIAYLAPEPASGRTAIWLAKRDGSNGQILVAGAQFEEIYAPMRFSPDGEWLAFAAADAANQLQRTPPARTGFSLWSLQPLLTLLPNVVQAHGLYPADVWLVHVRDGTLTRLTQLSEDHPTPVWSSDGRYLAFAGVLGVYLVDVGERRAVRVSDQGVDGQIEWVE